MDIFTKYYKVAGITFQVKSDLPILEKTFHPKFKLFEIKGSGNNDIIIDHHFKHGQKFDNHSWEEIYNRIPWTIYRSNTDLIYQRVHMHNNLLELYCTAMINQNHTHVKIYHTKITKSYYSKGMNDALTFFPTDQILLAHILSGRQGCFFHGNGVVFNNKGFLFLGHSGYGKSTIAKMLKSNGGKILCDDRMIIRKELTGMRMYGNWCHGKDEEYSEESFSLNAIFFISKSKTNTIRRRVDRNNIYQLLAFLIKPLVTKAWWQNSFDLIEDIAHRIPCYDLDFDKTGTIVNLLKKIE